MQLIAAESRDFSSVALRGAGHDVISIAESTRGAEDNQVVEFAGHPRPQRALTLYEFSMTPDRMFTSRANVNRALTEHQNK